MDAQSVIALKQELVQTVLSRQGAPTEAFSMSLVVAGGPEDPGIVDDSLAPTEGIALGRSEGRSKGDFRLAVRVQDDGYSGTAALVEQIKQKARGEVDVVRVGVIQKGPPPSGTTGAKGSRGWMRPLAVGCSVSHFNSTAGTLGGFFTDRKTKEPVMLSNNHVFADENRARQGDAILQPGPADGGTLPADQVGSLLRFVPLKAAGENLVDAACATLSVDHDPMAYDVVWPIIKGVRREPVDIGEKVFKIGRSTGATEGIVTAIDLSEVWIRYGTGDFRFAQIFEAQGEGGPFSMPGDSGSIIVDEEGLMVGLLFAGSTKGGRFGSGYTYANDINVVMNALKIDF